MNENSFYDLSIQTVKNACERYWLDKDVSYFMNHLYSEDTPAIGLDMGDEDGFYKIDKATYEGSVQQENVCVVTAKLVLYDTEFCIHIILHFIAVAVQMIGGDIQQNSNICLEIVAVV